MTFRICGCCGELVSRRDAPWSVVDPDWDGAVEYLRDYCLQSLRHTRPETFVFSDPSTHRVTLLSDTGLRLAGLDARRGHRAA